MWKTRSVCHPLSGALNSNRCIAKDPQNNHEFDLMPLSDYNHQVSFKGNMEFLINICKPTLYGHNEMCPPESSICLDNPDEMDVKKRFTNYGNTVPDPTFENGKLFMNFTSNEKCTNKDTNITSIINFICDETIQVNPIQCHDEIVSSANRNPFFSHLLSVWPAGIFGRRKL